MHAVLLSNIRYSTEGTYRPEWSQAKSLLDIGTRLIFSEEHDIFRQSVRRFFQEEVIPHYDQWEEDGQVSKEVWLKAGEQGLLGISTPEEAGGIGGDFYSAAVLNEEQYYANAPGLGFVIHSDIVMDYIHKYSSQEGTHPEVHPGHDGRQENRRHS